MPGQVLGLICSMFITLQIDIADQEDYGQRNYLLRSNQIPGKVCTGSDHVVASNHNDIFISVRAHPDQPLGDEGDVITIVLDAECFQAFGVDEEATERSNVWISYRSWLCDATKITLIANNTKGVSYGNRQIKPLEESEIDELIRIHKRKSGAGSSAPQSKEVEQRRSN